MRSMRCWARRHYPEALALRLKIAPQREPLCTGDEQTRWFGT